MTTVTDREILEHVNAIHGDIPARVAALGGLEHALSTRDGAFLMRLLVSLRVLTADERLALAAWAIRHTPFDADGMTTCLELVVEEAVTAALDALDNRAAGWLSDDEMAAAAKPLSARVSHYRAKGNAEEARVTYALYAVTHDGGVINHCGDLTAVESMMLATRASDAARRALADRVRTVVTDNRWNRVLKAFRTALSR